MKDLRSSCDNVTSVSPVPAEADVGGVSVVGVDPEDDITQETHNDRRGEELKLTELPESSTNWVTGAYA